MTHTQHRNIPAMLDALDRNHDGMISATELHEGLVSLGVQLQAGQLRQIMSRADADGDGRVSRAELEQTLVGYAAAEQIAHSVRIRPSRVRICTLSRTHCAQHA
jgi:Ca2+-binding EF-hand superfamily protein